MVVKRISCKAKVVILGPLPRLAGELRGSTWNGTAAYRLERTPLRNGPGNNATVIPLRRLLTSMMGRERNGMKGCEPWFHPGGVHLSGEGSAKLVSAGAFPG